MAGFFSLDNTRNNNNNNNNNTSKNEVSYQWQQQLEEYYVPLYPSRIECEQRGDESSSNTTRSSYNFMMMMPMSGSGSGSGSNTISCQDCGNQAKKDCVYMRCRTCCKSRGFDCATHVKSTWVPASVRRERHQNVLRPQQQEDELLGVNPQQPKRRRDNNTSSSLVCTTHHLPVTTNTNTTTTFSGMEVGNFPAEVSSSAVFRCVRVTGVEDNEEEYAYQTAVNIGGHVFKGILYDQGPDHQQQQGGGTPSPTYAPVAGGDSSYGGNLTMGPTASIGGSTSASAMPTSSSSPTPGYLDPSFFPIPLNAYLPPGTPFFPNPRP